MLIAQEQQGKKNVYQWEFKEHCWASYMYGNSSHKHSDHPNATDPFPMSTSFQEAAQGVISIHLMTFTSVTSHWGDNALGFVQLKLPSGGLWKPSAQRTIYTI